MRGRKANQAFAFASVGGFVGGETALEQSAAVLRYCAEGQGDEDDEGCYGLFHCIELFSCFLP